MKNKKCNINKMRLDWLTFIQDRGSRVLGVVGSDPSTGYLIDMFSHYILVKIVMFA